MFIIGTPTQGIVKSIHLLVKDPSPINTVEINPAIVDLMRNIGCFRDPDFVHTRYGITHYRDHLDDDSSPLFEGALLSAPVIAGRWMVFGTDRNFFYVLEEVY